MNHDSFSSHSPLVRHIDAFEDQAAVFKKLQELYDEVDALEECSDPQKTIATVEQKVRTIYEGLELQSKEVAEKMQSSSSSEKVSLGKRQLDIIRNEYALSCISRKCTAIQNKNRSWFSASFSSEKDKTKIALNAIYEKTSNGLEKHNNMIKRGLRTGSRTERGVSISAEEWFASLEGVRKGLKHPSSKEGSYNPPAN